MDYRKRYNSDIDVYLMHQDMTRQINNAKKYRNNNDYDGLISLCIYIVIGLTIKYLFS